MATNLNPRDFNAGPLVGATAGLLTLSWFTVGLRVYTRAVIMRSFMIDDWLIMIAQLSFSAMCATIFEGVRRGMGRHNLAIKSDDDRVAALKWQAVATILYIVAMMFVKLSIGVFLLRLSATKTYSVIIRVSLVIVGLYTAGVLFWDVFQCIPVAKQWDYRITEGHCASGQDIANAAYAISALTVVSDWFYALLPIPMLWSVKMTKQAKITVVFILGLGIFASIATLIRVKYLAALVDTSDLLYTATNAMLWSVIEPGVAIIASSLATVRPLLRALKIRGFETTHRWNSSGFSNRKHHTSSAGRHDVSAGRHDVSAGHHDVSLHRVTVVNSEARVPTVNFDDYSGHAVTTPIRPTYGNEDLGNKVSISAGEGSGAVVGSHEPKNDYVVTETPAPTELPAWRGHHYSVSDRSMEDFVGLEEQSQEVDLGLSSRGRAY